MCNTVLRFQESTQNSTEKLLNLDRARPDWEPAFPRTLRGPGREIDRNVAWRHTALQTTALRDFSRAWVVCNTVKPVKSREVGMVAPWQNFLRKNVKMDVKTSFFDVMSEVQKDLQDISPGIGQFKTNPT